MTPDCYGGIIFDDDGRVLVRKPVGGWGGFAWTFAKGTPQPNESPEDTALREVLEETGFQCEVVRGIPGAFESATCWTSYFLMRPVRQARAFDEETEEVRWAEAAESRALLSQSSSLKGRARDLAALEAALAVRQKSG